MPRAAARAGVRRIIYLGGLADAPGSLSTHLKSRAETGDALRAGGVPVVEFRASIIIGAGSLSFEMIRALVERLPVMICRSGLQRARSRSPSTTSWRTWTPRSICRTASRACSRSAAPKSCRTAS